MQWDLINPTAAPTVPCPESKKDTEMSEFISVFFAFRDFCLFAIVVFFEVPLVLSFQGKNGKKNLILDILNRCQKDKLKFEAHAFAMSTQGR